MEVKTDALTAGGNPIWLDRHVEEQLIAAFGSEGPLAEALVQQERIEAALRELEAARFSLSQYISNTRLLETIGLDAFNEGAEAHQQRVDVAQAALTQARSQQDAVRSALDGNLLRAWRNGELTPLERRTIIARVVDRVILYRANQKGNKTAADIGKRVQIVLRSNELLAPAERTEAVNATVG